MPLVEVRGIGPKTLTQIRRPGNTFELNVKLLRSLQIKVRGGLEPKKMEPALYAILCNVDLQGLMDHLKINDLGALLAKKSFLVTLGLEGNVQSAYPVTLSVDGDRFLTVSQGGAISESFPADSKDFVPDPRRPNVDHATAQRRFRKPW